MTGNVTHPSEVTVVFANLLSLDSLLLCCRYDKITNSLSVFFVWRMSISDLVQYVLLLSIVSFLLAFLASSSVKPSKIDSSEEPWMLALNLLCGLTLPYQVHRVVRSAYFHLRSIGLARKMLTVAAT